MSKTMSPDEAANFLGVTRQTLAVWRCTGRYALPYCKAGGRVRYLLADLERFLADRTYAHTGKRLEAGA